MAVLIFFDPSFEFFLILRFHQGITVAKKEFWMKIFVFKMVDYSTAALNRSCCFVVFEVHLTFAWAFFLNFILNFLILLPDLVLKKKNLLGFINLLLVLCRFFAFSFVYLKLMYDFFSYFQFSFSNLQFFFGLKILQICKFLQYLRESSEIFGNFFSWNLIYDV